jgi:hypothetical protein
MARLLSIDSASSGSWLANLFPNTEDTSGIAESVLLSEGTHELRPRKGGIMSDLSLPNIDTPPLIASGCT